MYGVLLIGVLVVTGGAIAFIGDRLGSKIGKKRLSIFGLRPRHTSVLITIVTGICITTLTFGVMAAVSENVRTALFGMERLNQTMQETQADLREASSELSAAQVEKDAINKALLATKEDLEKLQSDAERLQRGNQLLEQKNFELLSSNASLSEKNSTLEMANKDLLSGNATLNATNDRLIGDNKMLETRMMNLRKGFLTMREGDIVFRANEVLASGVIRGNRPKEEVLKDMGMLMNLANQSVTQRLGEDAPDKDIWIFQPEYDAAAEEIAKSKKDMIVRIIAAGNLVRGEPVCTSLLLCPNSIIYQKDEFIIARSYKLPDAGNNGHVAEQYLMSFLKDVNQQATMRGILPDPISGSVGAMEGEQFYKLVNDLSVCHGSVVLSAYARYSTDALGPLRLKVKIAPTEDAEK